MVVSHLMAGQALALEAPCDGSYKGTVQVDKYCSAAQAADDAVGPQNAVGAIHGVVAGVCTAACAIEAFGGTGWCTGVAIGGAAANLAISLDAGTDWMNAVMGLGGIGVSMVLPGLATSVGSVVASSATTELIAKGAEEGAKEAARTAGEEASKKVLSRGTACLTAAISILASVMSFDGASSSKDSRKDNIANARKLINEYNSSIEKNRDISTTLASAGSEVNAGGAPVGSSPQRGGAPGSGNGGGRAGLSCGGSGFDSTLNCALSAPGNNLPPFVSSPEFKKAIEQLSGRSADEVIAQGSAQGIAQATLANALNKEGQDKFAALIGNTRGKYDREMASSGSVYASGKGGGAKKGVESSYNFALPDGAGGTAATGAVTTTFNGMRVPASLQTGVEEDPSVSLFLRVSSRYYQSREKVMTLEYGLLQNRLLQGQKATR
jgi:hypothetical protein